MAKAKITDEEYAELESQQRHEQLITVLEKIASTNYTEKLERLITQQSQQLTQQSQQLAQLVKKDVLADLKPLLQQLVTAMKELKPVTPKQPVGFQIQRDKLGLIERVTVEKSNGN